MPSNIMLLVVERFTGIIYFVRLISGVATRVTNLEALVTKNVQCPWHARKGFEKSLHS